MDVVKWQECPDNMIDKFPYRGKMHEVIGTSVRWLSKFGDDGNGYPEYGLRLFTIQPGGQIPIHNHFYHQTMFIVEGSFECWAFDPETDEKVATCQVEAGESIYIPSLEPHGMRNTGSKPGRFLCCICNVYQDSQKD